MEIPRLLEDDIRESLRAEPNKIIILYGPRQVGKTTLIDKISAGYATKLLKINADEKKYIDILSSSDLSKLRLLTDGYDCLFIDEAQRVPNIGINLKLLHDHMPDLRIIASGSSSFELANKIKEPLTGRTKTFHLYPVAYSELNTFINTFELTEKLGESLVYGLYPEVVTMQNMHRKEAHLRELASSYLYKDVLELETIRHSDKLAKLLQLLAFQIGNQVSISEIARSLGLAQETTAHYIDLLEKSFVIFRLSGFSRNLRKEVTKMDKIYFYDLGIRNSVINNFSPIDQRNDTGQLFENFLITERIKTNYYHQKFIQTYFWRLNTGAEIDYIEDENSRLSGFEFKFNYKVAKQPKSWADTYPGSTFETVNLDNFIEFVCKGNA